MPKYPLVEDAYVEEKREEDALVKVWRALNVFAVYVFGIVVDACIKELAVEFKNVVSSVSALLVFNNPEPRRLLNDEPFTTRFVVEAYVAENSVDDEFVNVCNPVHEFVFERLSDATPFAYDKPPENVVVAPE